MQNILSYTRAYGAITPELLLTEESVKNKRKNKHKSPIINTDYLKVPQLTLSIRGAAFQKIFFLLLLFESP